MGVQTQGVYTRAVKGSVVNAATSIAELALGFGGSIVLARILDPVHFGIFAFAMVFVAVFDGLSSFQTQSYVIQSKENVKRTMSVGFTVELIAAAAAVILLLLTSPHIFRALGRSEQVLLTQVFAFWILVRPFRVARVAFIKELGFVQVSVALLAGIIVGTSLKIGLALTGWGAWSLMIGTIAVTVVECAIVWSVVPCRPGLSLDRGILWDVIRFGTPLLILTLLLQVWTKIGDFMVGNLMDDYGLGVYYLAYRIPFFMMILGQSVVQTAFPALSKAENRDQLTKGFQLTTKMTFMLFCLPVAVCVVWAPEMITLLYGERWLPAAEPLRIFVLIPLAHFTVVHFGDLHKTQGRTKEPMYVMLGQVIFVAPVGYLLLNAFGLRGIAVAILAAEIAPLPLISWMVNRFVTMNYFLVLWRTATVAGTALVLGVLLKDLAGGRVWAMVLIMLMQCVLYLIGITLVEREDVGRVRSEVWNILKRRAGL